MLEAQHMDSEGTRTCLPQHRGDNGPLAGAASLGTWNLFKDFSRRQLLRARPGFRGPYGSLKHVDFPPMGCWCVSGQGAPVTYLSDTRVLNLKASLYGLTHLPAPSTPRPLEKGRYLESVRSKGLECEPSPTLPAWPSPAREAAIEAGGGAS